MMGSVDVLEGALCGDGIDGFDGLVGRARIERGKMEI